MKKPDTIQLPKQKVRYQTDPHKRARIIPSKRKRLRETPLKEDLQTDKQQE